MTPLKAEFMSSEYEIVELDNFSKNLKDFDKHSQRKITERLKEWLTYEPKRFPMLLGAIPVCGRKLFGLRHIKIGVSGHKGGAYVLYRICEECFENEYWKKSNLKCQFCDPKKTKRNVLFDVQPRSFDYGR
jgi:hypothetical protein